MKHTSRFLIVAAVLFAVGATLAARKHRTGAIPTATLPRLAVAASVTESPLPRLVDLGARKCVPCRMMAPILQDLATSLVARLEVEFIDVWEKPEAAEPFGINLIPTQIFFAPDGAELFRHEGFFSKEDILGKWKELGFDLAEEPAA